MRLKDIIRSEESFTENVVIRNDIITSVDLNVIGHFGNCSSLEIYGNNIAILHGYPNTANVGYLIRALVELFEISEEDGLRLSDIKNIPCRILLDGSPFGRCIGFGHFMKNKFVYTEDFVRIAEY